MRPCETGPYTPGISSIAIVTAPTSLIVDPSLIGINHSLSTLTRTATCGGTLLPSHRRVGFRLLSTDLLAMHSRSDNRCRESQASIHIENGQIAVFD